MRIALIGPESEENLALRYLAASVQQYGHQAEIFRFTGDDSEFDVDSLLGFEAGLVGLSMSFQAVGRGYLRLAQKLRRADFDGHITVGGHFPTLTYPMLLRDCSTVDSVVLGEGEHTLVELAGCLETNRDWSQVSGIAYRASSGAVARSASREPCRNLDRIPFPFRTEPVPTQLGIPMASLVASRGCSGACTFCSIRSFHRAAGGPAYRFRSPENIADEMERLHRDRGVRLCIFHDDNFLGLRRQGNLSRMKVLAREMRTRGLSETALIIKARPESVDPELFSILRDMGLVRVYVGVESGNEAGLRAYGRAVPLNTICSALSTIQHLGIFGSYNVLTFFPDATLSSIREDIAFMRDHSDMPFNFGRVEVYSRTPLEKTLSRQRRLSGNYLCWNYRMCDDRAELTFRISSVVLRSRTFQLGGVANSLSTLGYQPDLLRKVFPGCDVSDEAADVKALIREANGNTLDYLSAIIDFTQSPHTWDADSVRQFARDAGIAVNREDLVFTRTIADLQARLLSKAKVEAEGGVLAR